MSPGQTASANAKFLRCGPIRLLSGITRPACSGGTATPRHYGPRGGCGRAGRPRCGWPRAAALAAAAPTSDASVRSGVAQSLKFKTWASPHSCTSRSNSPCHHPGCRTEVQVDGAVGIDHEVVVLVVGAGHRLGGLQLGPGLRVVRALRPEVRGEEVSEACRQATAQHDQQP